MTADDFPDVVGALPGPWVADALCAQVDAELWFPKQGGSPATAKRICRACPVRVECLDFAIDTGPVAGIWGGLTGKQRRGLRRKDAA